MSATENRPNWFVLVGGINGAGKSTFSQNAAFLRKLVELSAADSIHVINPDTLTRSLRASDPALSEQEANLRAAVECEREVRALIEARQGNFVVETVLSTDKYKSIVERALKNEWKVFFVYVALTSVEEAIARVHHRVMSGGHAVSEEKIRSRWPRSLANLPWFWGRATSCFLVLNREKFGTPELLASKQKDWTHVRHVSAVPHAMGPVLQATSTVCGARLR